MGSGHSDSLTNVPQLTEMVATGDLGKGKELGREGEGQLRWRHRVKIPVSRRQSLKQRRGWQREVGRALAIWWPPLF